MKILATLIILIISILGFIWYRYNESITTFQITAVLNAGALVVINGHIVELLDIFTYGFIHTSTQNLITNTASMIIFMLILENTIGSIKALSMFIISLVGSAILYPLFQSTGISTGMSAGIFTIVTYLILTNKVPNMLRILIFIWLIIQLAFTFNIPQISITLHLIGILIGIIAHLITQIRIKKVGTIYGTN